MTKEQRETRIAEIERRFSRRFLCMSLHGDAIEWRRLTAQNAASHDDQLPAGQATSKD